jgi:HPt (histidine-containing phosphotransfer) domain-containing protein
MSDPTGIDPQALAQLHKIGGPDFVRKMIELFMDEAPKRLTAARNAERAGDLKAIGEAAHSLKSSALNFGGDRMALTAEKIEVLTRSNSSENLSLLLDDLDQAFAQIKAWLENQREGLK